MRLCINSHTITDCPEFNCDEPGLSEITFEPIRIQLYDVYLLKNSRDSYMKQSGYSYTTPECLVQTCGL